MKKLIIILTVTGLLALPSIGLAQTCASPITIPDFISDAAKVTTIRNALAAYTSYPVGGHYELCFTMSELDLSQAELVSTLAMTTSGSESLDVYIVGLNIRSDPLDPLTSTLLEINNSGTAGIILKDLALHDMPNVLQLKGNPGIRLVDSAITGDEAKSGSCVDIQAKGVQIEGIDSEMTITSCGKAVSVSGSNARIKNCKIWDNKIGVNIATGVIGTDIEGSRIYSNDDEVMTGPDDRQRYDGVRITDGAAHKPRFYALINNEPEEIPDNSETAINYGTNPAYILLNFSIGQVDPSRVEIMTSHTETCGLPLSVFTRSQPCGAVMADGSAMKMDISPSDLEDGSKEIVVPPEYRDKDLVVMYSDPGEGTAGISREFKWSVGGGGVVAFVSNPYDIPTTGGASETELTSGGEEEIEQGPGSELEGGGISGEGGGGGIIAAASGGCGGGGASLANNSFRHVVFSFNVWWILMALALFGAFRFAHVKVRQRGKS